MDTLSFSNRVTFCSPAERAMLISIVNAFALFPVTRPLPTYMQAPSPENSRTFVRVPSEGRSRTPLLSVTSLSG